MLSQFKRNAVDIAEAAAQAEKDRESSGAAKRRRTNPTIDDTSSHINGNVRNSSKDENREKIEGTPNTTEIKSLPTVPVRTIYIVCPPRVQTGGPEALHQLCGLLNNHPSIHNAYMLYIQENDIGEIIHIRAPSATPVPYRNYNCPHAPSLPSRLPNELIIYPECWTHLIDSYPMCQTAIYWLSVDNNHGKFKQFHRKDILHLYQCYYAKNYLLSHLTPPENILEMTEYVSPSRFPNESAVEGGFRDLDVIYNPSKGVHYTDEIRARSEEGYKRGGSSSTTRSSSYLPTAPVVGSSANDNTNKPTTSSLNTKMKFRPIGEGIGGRQRITPEEVTSLLLRSKVYIDFGQHPGMDRLPREAALCGCIIVTNGEGAAGFSKDYPIPEEYRVRKFDTDVIHTILRKSLDEFETRRHHFDDYRKWIMGQFNRMEDCVNVFLNKVVDERRKNSDVDPIAILTAGGGEEDEERSYGRNEKKNNDDSSIESASNEAFNH